MHVAKNATCKHTIFAHFQYGHESRKVGLSSVNTLGDPSLS